MNKGTSRREEEHSLYPLVCRLSVVQLKHDVEQLGVTSDGFEEVISLYL